MRSTIQAMSPTDRLAFRSTMQTNLEGVPVEDRQAFRDTMRSGEGTGQNNQFMHGGSQGGSQGGGYGRGYGKR